MNEAITFLVICGGVVAVVVFVSALSKGGFGWLRPVVCGLAILLYVGSWLYGAFAVVFGVQHVILLLVAGPTLFLLASVMAFWRIGAGGALFVVTANAWAMAVIVFMTPRAWHSGAHASGVSLAEYVLQRSLPVILPASLPVLLLGMWFLAGGVDLGRIRRPWVQNSIRAFLVIGAVLVLAVSVSIIAAWFDSYIGRAANQ